MIFRIFEKIKILNVMANITLKGNEIHTIGNLPEVGLPVKDFALVNDKLEVKTLEDYNGKRKIFNIFPSIDTGTCAASVRKFNEKASALANTKVLCISRDLPFAQKRFCGAEGIENVVNLSDFKDGSFGKTNGLEIADGALAGLHSRCIIVVDASGSVIYTEQVPEIANEPNYEAALAAL